MTELAFQRMPHRGAMLLLASVERSDETSIACTARDHRGADYPLRRRGLLAAACLAELGAQTAAAHASLTAIEGAHVGLLLGLSGLERGNCSPDKASAPLRIDAERLPDGGGAARYRFRVSGPEGDVLAGEALLRMQAVGA